MNSRINQQGDQVSPKEIHELHKDFLALGGEGEAISRDQFNKTVSSRVGSKATKGSIFLERLFDVFDINGDHTVDFKEFVDGLSVFLKGTPEEKLELSFKIYDLNKDGKLERREVVKIMRQMYATVYVEDQNEYISELVDRIFNDLDVNGDGQLSLDEYKLMILKEPLIVNFLEQFLGGTEQDLGS